MDKDYNKIQINLNVRRDKDGNVIEKSTLINVRTEDPNEAFSLYKSLKDKLNGELIGNTLEKETYIESSETTTCPKCGGNLVKRTAKNGSRAGSEFRGCENFPHCSYTLAS